MGNKIKNKWIRFVNSNECSKLPRMLYAGMETANSPSYRWDGGKRQDTSKCVFQYTIEGCGCLLYHGNTYKVNTGKAFICDLSDPESCYFYPPGETKAWNFVYCVFSNFEELVKQFNIQHGPVYDFGEGNFLVKKLVSLLDSQESQRSIISNFKSYSFCTEIIGEMCRLIELRKNERSNSYLAMKTCALIHKKRLERFSLKKLSLRLGVCPEHLCREFKRHLNCSPKRYHDKLRIESICEMLLNDSDSIKEVAGHFGFDDISNFNKFFKKHCSITPGQFRRSSAGSLHDIFND